MTGRRLISSAEAGEGKKQHTTPCSDCPMARTSLPGWLGGSTPDEYVALSHSDHIILCHAIKNTQCAGMAIYRKHVCKSIAPGGLKLEAAHGLVFSWPAEFLKHHRREV